MHQLYVRKVCVVKYESAIYKLVPPEDHIAILDKANRHLINLIDAADMVT